MAVANRFRTAVVGMLLFPLFSQALLGCGKLVQLDGITGSTATTQPSSNGNAPTTPPPASSPPSGGTSPISPPNKDPGKNPGTDGGTQSGSDPTGSNPTGSNPGSPGVPVTCCDENRIHWWFAPKDPSVTQFKLSSRYPFIQNSIRVFWNGRSVSFTYNSNTQMITIDQPHLEACGSMIDIDACLEEPTRDLF